MDQNSFILKVINEAINMETLMSKLQTYCTKISAILHANALQCELQLVIAS